MMIDYYIFFYELRCHKVMEKLFKYSGGQSVTVETKKTWHKKQILRALYFSNSLTNAELSAFLNLSTPKVNSLLLEMVDEDIVEELGRGDSSGGRRPNKYGLRNDGFFVVGITININRTIISVFNAKNEVQSGPHIFPIKMQPDVAIFKQVNEVLEELVSKSQIPREKILVTGIELPGLIDLKKGVNRTYFPDVDNLFTELRQIFRTEVYFNHDAKIRTFAEQHFGLAKNRKHVLLLQADWGLGLGIITNGKLYSGKSGYSGEFGHLPIVENGTLCSCGKKGCLETMVSAVAIARMAREGILNGNSSLITEIVNNDLDKIDISTVTQAAKSGDQFAVSLFATAGHWLGRGIAYLIQIFNPELIIIGGSVAEAGQFIMAPVQQAIYSYSNHDISADTEIKFSELGSNAGPMGIAAYALEKLSMKK